MQPNFVDFVKSVTNRERDRHKTVNDIGYVFTYHAATVIKLHDLLVHLHMTCNQLIAVCHTIWSVFRTVIYSVSDIHSLEISK